MRGYLDRATTERTCAYHPGRKAGETPAPLYAPGSCQFVPQAVRNLLIGPHTFALRQRHADHRVLSWICKEIGRKVHHLPTRELTYFLNDPDSFVDDWREARSSMTEETVLHQLSQAIHWKGDPRTGHEPFKRFNQEAKSIMAVLASVPELKWAKELAEEQQARGRGGTIITVLVDAVQSNLTWAAIRAFEENGWPVCTCIHDKVSRERGCNVYRDGVDPDELVRLASEATEAIAPGCAEWEVTKSPTVVYDKKGEACHTSSACPRASPLRPTAANDALAAATSRSTVWSRWRGRTTKSRSDSNVTSPRCTTSSSTSAGTKMPSKCSTRESL